MSQKVTNGKDGKTFKLTTNGWAVRIALANTTTSIRVRKPDARRSSVCLRAPQQRSLR